MAMNQALSIDVDLEATSRFADLFDALSDSTRLAILQHLSTGPHRVRDLVAHLGFAQSTVSAHLACLKECGLVESRSEGRASWFSLVAADRLAGVLRAAEELLAETGNRVSLCTHLMHPHREVATR